MASKALLKDVFYAALRAADPYRAVKAYLVDTLGAHADPSIEKLFAIGFGKASCAMARALEDVADEAVSRGIVITKYGHSAGHALKKIKVIEAGHPLPDENGIRGANEIILHAKEADEKSLVICLISGGGSSLLVCPADGITLEDKMAVTGLLLRAGADIIELNAVRKHLSKVKGGRLAEILYPAKTVSLIVSDVIGDRLDVISSGPTSPDPTTYSDAMDVLLKYGLADRVPKSVRAFLQQGIAGQHPETPKKGVRSFDKVENVIIANNTASLMAAKKKAEELGIRAEILTAEVRGEARESAKWLAHAAMARKSAGADLPLMLISGGETTVTVSGKGKGGRNTEFALAFAIGIDGFDAITLLSAGTDGTDGPTEAAGAYADSSTLVRARARGLVADIFLANNDSCDFFEKTGDLLVTGPTGTNVMDIQLVLIP